MERMLMGFLAGGGVERLGACEIRLLTARQLLEARQEAEIMEGPPESRGLRSNACLLSRSLYRDGVRVFYHGKELLEAWSAEDIGRAMERYEAEENKNIRS